MFAGIVEATGQIRNIRQRGGVYEISVSRPLTFDRLELGESIAVDGVCLTLESETKDLMQFAIGTETIKILQLDPKTFLGKTVNLERSLAFGDRIHGHFVSGHVECQGEVISVQDHGGARVLSIRVPRSLKAFIWKKGSIAINGVSLTVNEVDDLVTPESSIISICIIPETLKRTNLSELVAGDVVNLESDYLSKIILRAYQTGYFKEEKHGL